MKDVRDEYAVMIGRFLGHTMSAEEFQSAFIEKFKNEDRPLSEPFFALLDEQFGNLDSFTRDKALLGVPDGFYLDEARLRSKTRDILRRLLNLDSRNAP